MDYHSTNSNNVMQGVVVQCEALQLPHIPTSAWMCAASFQSCIHDTETHEVHGCIHEHARGGVTGRVVHGMKCKG
jgi:hypothetical protein